MLEANEANMEKLLFLVGDLMSYNKEQPTPDDVSLLAMGIQTDFNKIGLCGKLGINSNILVDVGDVCLYGLYWGKRSSIVQCDNYGKTSIKHRINIDDVIDSIIESDKFYKSFIKNLRG